MNILMISLGTAMIDAPKGNTVRRHIDYARHAEGVLHMVTIVQRPGELPPQTYESGRFLLVPVCGSRPWSLILKALRAASSLARKNHYDLIYTQDPFGTALVGLWVRYRHSIPIIIGSHSSYLNNPHWIAERPLYFSFLHRIAKWTLPRADAWRVNNRFEREKYYSVLGIDRTRVLVNNTMVPLESFSHPVSKGRRAALRKQLGIEQDAPLAIWVGRPVRVKRLPLLFSAFKQVREIIPKSRLLLIGDFSKAQEDLASAKADNGLDDGSVISMSDGVSHEELADYYQMSDVYVHSSIYEGFGVVLVEAAAAGLPVVSTANDGARGIVVHGETGLLVPIEDASALAAGIVALLGDLDRASVMGEEAQRHVTQCFNAVDNMRQRKVFWQKVAEGGVGGRVHVADDIFITSETSKI